MQPAILIEKAALLPHPYLKNQLIELVDQCTENEQSIEYWPQAMFFDTFLQCLQAHQVPYELHFPAT